MATFPRAEAEVLILAQALSTGLATNATVFPAPPVTAVNLETRTAAALEARDNAITAQAAAQAAITAKTAAMQALIDDMKADLRYAENTAHNDDDKLKLLGWGAPAGATALVPPGQPGILAAPRQGEGWISLVWAAPLLGGAVASYKIQRRLRPDGLWATAEMALELEVTLSNQERNKEWEYRVTAVNKAGESEPSNTVMAVL